MVEVAIIATLFVLYNAGRLLTSAETAIAREHAELVRTFEAALPLPSEAWIQGWLSGAPRVLELANQYYVGLHFPVVIAFLVWGFLCRPRPEYRWARNLLVAMSFAALAIHVAFPLAPPRMFPEWGFVDTMTIYGPSAYDGASAAVANQFAAMPSLHIGWALIIAVVLARTAPRWLALLGAAHATVTVVVVVVTANHWWMDGIIAAALLAVALLVLPAPPRDAGEAMAPAAAPRSERG